ncbi:DUF554 domain-containing protein [soil metagenome]
MRGLGTVLNVVAVACGGVIGVFVGDRLRHDMRRTIMQGLGLVTLAVAIVGLEPLYDADAGLRRFIVMIVAVISGGLIGEALHLTERLESGGERLRGAFHVRDDADPAAGARGQSVDERVQDVDEAGEAGGTRVQGADAVPGSRSRFVDGFVVASTVFCVGPLTILGAVEDGLGDSIRLLAIKSALDGIASIGFASVYGWGVLGSLLTIALYQGLVTLGAASVAPLMTPEVLAQLGAVGSLLVMGIALRLLDIAEIRVVSLLPALFIGPLVAGAIEAFP